MSVFDWKLMLVQVLLPLLVICAAVGLREGIHFNIGSPNTDITPVNLSAWNHSLEVPFTANDLQLSQFGSPM